MSKLPQVDTYLGPEMKSTGEVMGIDWDYDRAMAKALLAAGTCPEAGAGPALDRRPRQGRGHAAGARTATAGCQLLGNRRHRRDDRGTRPAGAQITKRLSEGHPNVIDVIEDGEVDAVVNTVTGGARRSGTDSRFAAPRPSAGSRASPRSTRRGSPRRR